MLCYAPKQTSSSSIIIVIIIRVNPSYGRTDHVCTSRI